MTEFKRYVITFIVTVLVMSLLWILIPIHPVMGSGDSMEPAFSECSLMFVNEWHGDIEEGDVIVYESDHRDDDEIQKINHRVVDVVESYSPQESPYSIEYKEGEYNYFSIYERYTYTRESVQSMKEAKGETVYITKGDNNDVIDPDLVTEEQIQGVITYNTSVPRNLCNFKTIL